MRIQFTDSTTEALKAAMDVRQKNQQIIAANIANAETPGYAAARLDFEKSLQMALSDASPATSMRQTNDHHLPGVLATGSVVVEHVQDKTGLGDGNSVNLDQEMVLLAENQLHFEAAAQLINKKFALLKLLANDRT